MVFYSFYWLFTFVFLVFNHIIFIIYIFHYVYLIGILGLILFYSLFYRRSQEELFYLSLFYKFVFWKSIHLEVALESFCFLINSSWLLIFTLIIILFIFTGFNLYCWTGIHFS